MMKDLNLQFTCYSDPTHTLRNYLAEENLINIRVSGGENSTDSSFYQVHPKIKLYKHGVAQPGVLCITPERSVLYAWAIEPSTMNVGGASDRPVPADIWNIIQLKMSGNAGDEEIQQAYQQVRHRGKGSICTIL